MKVQAIWRERKRNILGLPWSFTVYYLTDEKLMIDTGVFNKTLEEVLLYRIIDLTIKRSFVQRIFGLGTIHCCTRDKSTPEFDLVNVKKSVEVKELIHKATEECRAKKGYTVRELMGNEIEDSDLDHDGLM
ncbi:MAG: PH domain-containing protein [Clostridia bacterium]|nr:PH domain-containing protein [Clostridia bacterium]